MPVEWHRRTHRDPLPCDSPLNVYLLTFYVHSALCMWVQAEAHAGSRYSVVTELMMRLLVCYVNSVHLLLFLQPTGAARLLVV